MASYLHRDALASVRAVTGADGAVDETAVYRPYGEQREWVLDASAAGEDKGFIGERYDADAGLQYLNARYYDPALAMFIQPDWFEVTEPGVGTNRYAYSFNDPVNLSDPGGNACVPCVVVAVVAYLSSTSAANAPGPGEEPLPPTGDRAMIDSVAPVAAVETAISEGDYLGAALEMVPGPNVLRSAGRVVRQEFSNATKRELIRQGYANPNPKFHHIVEAGSSAAKGLQRQLRSAGIEINSVDNGVGLSFHGPGRHQNLYTRMVERRLDGLTGTQVLDELHQIRDELLEIDKALADGSRRGRSGYSSPNTVREWALDQEELLDE